MTGRGPATYLLVGGVCGLTWAAALRGWMVQLARDQSTFSWMTFALLIIPAAAVGVTVGWAAYLRAGGRRPPAWSVWSPALLAVAVLDPTIFSALIHTGEGGGSLGVVVTALAGGHALSRRRWSVTRVASSLLAATGLLLMLFTGSMAGPMTSARGAWVSLLGVSLLLLLCLAASVPHATGPTLGRTGLVAVGGLAGAAWAAGLRSFMTEVAGAESEVHWGNTFGYIVLPGIVAGALLGWAEAERRAGRRRAWLALSPLTFTVILLVHFWQLPSLAQDGIGGGAIGVPVMGIVGGYALCGRGSSVGRCLAAVLFFCGLLLWALTATSVGGPSLGLGTAHGLWATTLYYGLLTTLALAVSIPLRTAVPPAHPGQARPRPTAHGLSEVRRGPVERVRNPSRCPALISHVALRRFP